MEWAGMSTSAASVEGVDLELIAGIPTGDENLKIVFFESAASRLEGNTTTD
jgi:hypothetical protein